MPPQNIPAENTSGQGSNSIIPNEIKGWSWGGFLWTWLWAISNKVWVGLLALIPIPGALFIMSIVLGSKGREWAWQHKHWESVESFKKTQRNWAKWWLIINVPLFIIAIIGIILTNVLVAINPHEQNNKANDASIRSTLSELLTASQRYYSKNNMYPWQSSTNGNQDYTTTDITQTDLLSKLVSDGEISQIILLPTKVTLIYQQSSNGLYMCYKPLSTTGLKAAESACSSYDPSISSYKVDLCTSGNELTCIPSLP